MIQQVIIKAVLKLLKKQFKLEKILKYVEEPNELDNKVDNLNDRIKLLESIAHEPKEYVTCGKCDKNVKQDKWYDK